MQTLVSALRATADTVVDEFYEALSRLPKSRQILAMLSEDELRHLKLKQAGNLRALAVSRLSAKAHADMALRVGRVHAIVGLDKEELARSRGILADSLYRLLSSRVEPRALAAYLQRLNVDLAWQLKAYQQLQDSQQDVLLRLTKMVWSVRSYTDFIQELMEILSGHDEIAGCSIGRPDAQGIFHFEAVSASKKGSHLHRLNDSPHTRIVTAADDPRGQGPIGLAWRTGKVERIINFVTSPQARPWREEALAQGIRSCAAIPLGMPGSRPVAVLTLDSAYPGGFVGPHQTAFIDLLKTLLDRAFTAFPDNDLQGRAISHANRLYWVALLRSGGLIMHYQPLLNLKTGAVAKVEALARLRDDGQLRAPADFLPALTSDDFLELYAQGLEQALTERHRWAAHGVELDISLNLPPAALNDIRYFEETRRILAAHACAPAMLTLEMLESEAVSLNDGQCGILDRFKGLGVLLAQDDLGAGHSSLANLRTLPFDWVKLDRELVRMDEADAMAGLRLVYQLTRLGQSLGKWVVAEGIESLDLVNALKILGVDAVQGYAVARPMDGATLLGWMRRGGPAGILGRGNQGALSGLARLLIWEERLLLNLAVPDLACRMEGLLHDGATAGEDGGLLTSLLAFEPSPAAPPARAALDRLLQALLKEGPRSRAFDSAHQSLVAAIAAAATAGSGAWQ